VIEGSLLPYLWCASVDTSVIKLFRMIVPLLPLLIPRAGATRQGAQPGSCTGWTELSAVTRTERRRRPAAGGAVGPRTQTLIQHVLCSQGRPLAGDFREGKCGQGRGSPAEVWIHRERPHLKEPFRNVAPISVTLAPSA
jgi:hypothetical protein